MQELSLTELNYYLDLFITRLTYYSPFTKNYFLDQRVTGCRHIELYEVSRWQEADTENFQLQPAKGGNLRLIKKTDLSQPFQNMINASLEFNPWCRYNKVQKIFNKHFEFLHVFVGNKEISTHLFRHAKFKNLAASGNSIEVIQQIMGESDPKNVTNYINSQIFIN